MRRKLWEEGDTIAERFRTAILRPGLEWGCGDASALKSGETWSLVVVDHAVRVPTAGGGYVRFKSGERIYCGDCTVRSPRSRRSASIPQNGNQNCGVGDFEVARVGRGGFASAGFRGWAIAGNARWPELWAMRRRPMAARHGQGMAVLPSPPKAGRRTQVGSPSPFQATAGSTATFGCGDRGLRDCGVARHRNRQDGKRVGLRRRSHRSRRGHRRDIAKRHRDCTRSSGLGSRWEGALLAVRSDIDPADWLFGVVGRNGIEPYVYYNAMGGSLVRCLSLGG